MKFDKCTKCNGLLAWPAGYKGKDRCFCEPESQSSSYVDRSWPNPTTPFPTDRPWPTWPTWPTDPVWPIPTNPPVPHIPEYGWICPRCNASNAPGVKQCPSCK